jgi:hypothetical protein
LESEVVCPFCQCEESTRARVEGMNLNGRLGSKWISTVTVDAPMDARAKRGLRL